MIDRFRRRIRRHMPAGAALLAALALGACQTGEGSRPLASADITTGTKPIAFESIDGPPEAVFNKLVASLATEADARRIRVVSRESDPVYRVRGYLAASVENGKGTVDWVWDVFDADRQRVLRVAGAENVGPGKDVWKEVDGDTVNRIAAQSLDEISTRLAQGLPPKPTGAVPQGAPDAAAEPAPEDLGPPPAVRTDDGPPIASTEPSGAMPGTMVAQAPEVPTSALTFAAHP
ncbi:hypothetical protein [Ancylobacter pratisalsi]|uniref:DUF4410 domain-containing protein n=1 Tax=Ancylobacter pratisalsi TaxID=1745854 RepID=A0A6P1YHY7_9HYPH|nr:hypothetical protein [Ancylobacter pratisalsi]QIB32772.1 hypothetical protein G3A50_02915 [Ancylobacter pratisalsi]